VTSSWPTSRARTPASCSPTCGGWACTTAARSP
jgi:hypothetical protein